MSNLELAVIRLNTSMNTYYKQFFRPLYQMYNINARENLHNLQTKLRSHSYSPNEAVKIYSPKPSGLQRPITLLSIEDQILLQAIANIYADYFYSTFKKLIGREIFSNWPQKSESIFFLQKWQYSYKSYINTIKKSYKEGNEWIVQFDLSSFFDTIDHDLLLKCICPKKGNSVFQSDVKRWLRCWTSENTKNEHSHGIPQGPTASGFLAECFMLPIDTFFSGRISYLRYVDDIRLMGKKEIQVRKALVTLDKLCKERGLIPNVEKTGIKHVTTYEELESDLPQFFLYHEYTDLDKWPERKIISLLKEIVELDDGNYKITNKSKFRYLLYRAQASDYLLNLILSIWQLTPEHTSGYIAFITNNYAREERIINFCKSTLTNDYPYDYVRGELWKLLAKYGEKKDLLPLIDKAINLVKQNEVYSAERIGIYSFLLSCERLNLGNYSSWICGVKNSIILSQVEPYMDLSCGKFQDMVNIISKRHLIDAWLGLINKIRNAPNFFADYHFPKEKFPSQTLGTLTKLGIINVKTKIEKNYIGTYLHSHYSTTLWKGWKTLLGNEYIHVWNLLSESNLYYEGYASAWLVQIDAIMNCVFKCFIELFNKSGKFPNINLINRKGELNDYGNLLANITLQTECPSLCNNLQTIHNRRITLPEAHPYEKKTGKRNLPLKYNERNYFRNLTQKAFEDFVIESKNLGIN